MTTSSIKSTWSSVTSDSFIFLPKIISIFFIRVLYIYSWSSVDDINLAHSSLASLRSSENESCTSLGASIESTTFAPCFSASSMALARAYSNSLKPKGITGSKYLYRLPANTVGLGRVRIQR